MGYASTRGSRKQARKNKHSQMMTAFHRFLESCGSDRPIEGEQRYSDMLTAFRAGFSAARTDTTK